MGKDKAEVKGAVRPRLAFVSVRDFEIGAFGVTVKSTSFRDARRRMRPGLILRRTPRPFVKPLFRRIPPSLRSHQWVCRRMGPPRQGRRRVIAHSLSFHNFRFG